uniref:Uncharacterized protein n=1 Tax=Globodera rostochiensis TaxID=31243 RepID=A0A914GVJ3_GLORO
MDFLEDGDMPPILDGPFSPARDAEAFMEEAPPLEEVVERLSQTTCSEGGVLGPPVGQAPLKSGWIVPDPQKESDAFRLMQKRGECLPTPSTGFVHRCSHPEILGQVAPPEGSNTSIVEMDDRASEEHAPESFRVVFESEGGRLKGPGELRGFSALAQPFGLAVFCWVE